MSDGTMVQQNVEGTDKNSDLLAWQRIVDRLPLTLRPAMNQQLSQWEMLFPFEQKRLRNFFLGLDSFSSSERSALMAPLYALESKMGVVGWHFSEKNDTIENASQLARSEYYREWRREIQEIFRAIDARSPKAEQQTQPKRLVLLLLPASLPVDPNTVWEAWKPQASVRNLTGGGARELSELLIKGRPGRPGIPMAWGSQQNEPADLWLIDAENYLGSGVPNGSSAIANLSYATLKTFRDKFLAGLNTIPKDIAAADQTTATLRQTDWTRWCPPELVQQKRLRNFVVDLFLSGNGALIFSNAFVEWAASEAFRRARPSIVIARFGVRSKPKPFTSIAIFENQEKVSTVPDVADPENSAVDAAILAHYIWLAARRYTEFDQSVCCCISEHLNAMSVIAPQGSSMARLSNSPSAEEVYQAIHTWLAL